MEIMLLSFEQYDEIIRKLDILLTDKNNMTNSGQLLTGTKVCEMLDISPRTLQNYRDRGMISFSQVGRKIYYTTEEVEIFIEKHKIGRIG
ncbi:MAG: helix-turn-helix domain-containing protein [Puia sp.]